MARKPIPSLAWPAVRRPRFPFIALEASAVAAVLAVPLALPGFHTFYPLITLFLAAGYMGWAAESVLRRRVPGQPRAHRAIPYMFTQFVGGTLFAGGLATMVFAIWIPAVYRWEVLTADNAELPYPLAFAGMGPAAAGISVVTAALFAGTLILLRRNDEDAGAIYKRVRAGGVKLLQHAVAAWLLFGMAALALANVAYTGVALPNLLRSIDPAQIVDLEFLLENYPGFAAAIAGAAVLLVAFRRMQPLAMAFLHRPPRATRIPELLAILASAGAAAGWYLYFLHIWIVAAFGAIPMVPAWGQITRATDGWIDSQQASGRQPAEIAADLRDHGTWSADAPGTGLPALLPELGDDLKHLGLAGGCTVSIETGIASNAALQGLSWIEGYVAAFRPLPPISYCVRLACPSPVSMHEHPVVVFGTSHPSRNKGWAYNVFIDSAARGRAPMAGGHCTADGKLSAGYRG